MGGDYGTAGLPARRCSSITLGGIFVISTLIGILNTGIEAKLAELRKGRSRVVERDHTVILGWSQQIFTIISRARRSPTRTSARRAIVVLADRDKVEMEDEIRDAGRRRPAGREIVCRSGSPMDLDDLEHRRPADARGRSSCSRPRATSRTPT